jgi:hypothetical protein
MTSEDARLFVLRTRVRFVLEDCGSSADLRHSLAPIARGIHQFGCATVFEVT